MVPPILQEGYGVFHTHYNLGGGHSLLGHSVPNFELEDGTRIGELMHDGQGILLDFDMNASLKTLASEYENRMKYVSAGRRTIRLERCTDTP
jgi:hypothetical protein